MSKKSRRTKHQKRLSDERKGRGEKTIINTQRRSSLKSTTSEMENADEAGFSISRSPVSRPKETTKTAPKKAFTYQETAYDQALRRHTWVDLSKTAVIIAGLFVMQFMLYIRYAP